MPGEQRAAPGSGGSPGEKEPHSTQPCASFWTGLWDGWGSLLVTAGGAARLPGAAANEALN